MQGLAPGAVLASEAARLNQNLAVHLGSLARRVNAEPGRLNRLFDARLRRLRFSTAQRKALVSITFGAAAPALVAGSGLCAFLEQAEYNGRRLAKLEVSPARVVAALRQYDELIAGHVEQDASPALEQFHFLAILALNHAYYQVREAESQAFYSLFHAEAASQTLDRMLARFLSTLIAYTRAADGRFYLAGMNARPLPADLSKPCCFEINGRTGRRVLDPLWRGKYRYCWSLPLVSGGVLRGLLQFAFAKPYRWLPRELALLKGAAERCWLAAEKTRLLESLADREAQVRGLAARMLEVEQAERRRISRELHDEAGQSLLCVRLQLEMIERDLPDSCAHLAGKLTEARRTTEHSITEIRRLIADLSPSVLEHVGLNAALRQLAARLRKLLPVEVTLSLPRGIGLPANLQIVVYRLVQEVFNNIVKYSHASRVNLSLSSADECLMLRIEDDGVGFDVEEAFSRRGCFGLSGLRERVRLMGGVISISSLPRTNGRGASARSTGKSSPGAAGVRRPGTAVVIEFPLLPEPRQQTPEVWEQADGKDTHSTG